MRTILLLDDEQSVLNALQRALRHAFSGSAVTIETFTDPEQALFRCAEQDFDVIVSDYRMPSLTGADFLQMAKGIQPDAVRIVLSASTEFSEIMGAINRGEVFRYLAKPWQNEELHRTIELAFARRDDAIAARRRRAQEQQQASQAQLSPQEAEARRLEREEPGITQVRRGPDGEIYVE